MADMLTEITIGLQSCLQLGRLIDEKKYCILYFISFNCGVVSFLSHKEPQQRSKTATCSFRAPWCLTADVSVPIIKMVFSQQSSPRDDIYVEEKQLRQSSWHCPAGQRHVGRKRHRRWVPYHPPRHEPRGSQHIWRCGERKRFKLTSSCIIWSQTKWIGLKLKLLFWELFSLLILFVSSSRHSWYPCPDPGKSHHRTAILHSGQLVPHLPLLPTNRSLLLEMELACQVCSIFQIIC